jgi:predicted RNA-binding protein
MSLAKRWMQEQEDNDYRYIGDKYVCAECFSDYAIKNFINENSVENYCTYCGSSSKVPFSARIDDVMEFIVAGIHNEWGHPGDECVGWDSHEGGWQGDVYDSYDLIMEDVLELGCEKEPLMKDIYDSLGSDKEWCEINPYALRIYEEDYIDWMEFSNQVKHKVRFVFFKIDETSRFSDFERNPYEILERLGEIVKELDLTKTLIKGTVLFRARIHKENEELRTVDVLGPPKTAQAIYPNRMSPAGIPMFYGAINKDVAIAEVKNNITDDKNHVTIAQFTTLCNMQILDFSVASQLKIPSLFDKTKGHLRSSIIFLKNFLDDFTKLVSKDGTEHIDYVPTQIVTEYFRHVFTNDDNERLSGIVYPSASDVKGSSCVLFYENKHCMQDDKIDSEQLEKKLCLITSKTQTICMSSGILVGYFRKLQALYQVIKRKLV